MWSMTHSRGPWVLLSVLTSLLLTAAARPLGHSGLVGDVSRNTLVVQERHVNALIERLIGGAGLQSKKFSFVKDIVMNLGFIVGKGSEGLERAGEAVELKEFRPVGSEEGLLAQARGVSTRDLLQNGGNSQQQQPGNGGRYVTDNMLGDSLLSILLALGFCVALFIVMLTRRFCMSRRRRQRRLLLGDPPPRIQEAPSAALPYSILKGLPIVSFKKEGENQTFNQGNGENQCPICLIEFEPKDSLRKLPECSHYFHQACVDEWFKRNHTCPLCRTSLLPSEPSSAAAATSADTASSQAQTEIAASSRDGAVMSVAALEQEAGQAGPGPAPLEREGPGARL